MNKAVKPAGTAPAPGKVVTPQPAPGDALVAVSNGSVANFSGGLLAQLAAQAKDVQATEKVATSTISMRAGVLSWQGQPMPGNKMNVIVLATSYENTFYPENFDPNNIKSPACFAQGLKDDGNFQPHANSAQPQSEDCASCWANAWKSDPKGGRGKACKQVRKLAVIPAYKTTAEIEAAEMATLRVPVMSVKNWSHYANERATIHGLPPICFVTEVLVRPDPRSQFVVEFKAEGLVPDDEMMHALMKRVPQAEALLMTPYDMRPEEKEEPAAPAGKRKY